MTNALEKRLERLAGRLGAGPCRTCGWWERSLAVCDDRGRCTRPEVCPDCGRHVPLRVARIIVGIDLDRV